MEGSKDELKINVLAPGVIEIENGLNEAEQIVWTDYAMACGKREKDGFYIYGRDGKKVLNFTPRGRIYDNITAYPQYDKICEMVHKAITIAMESDTYKTLRMCTPTHLLLNYYSNEEGIWWHSDDDPNDGDEDFPIVSISLGNSCEFGYSLFGESKTITLKSGNILVWGGTNRMLRHSVLKCNMGTCPKILTELSEADARINYTLRYAPSIVGKEDDWKIQQPKYT